MEYSEILLKRTANGLLVIKSHWTEGAPGVIEHISGADLEPLKNLTSGLCTAQEFINAHKPAAKKPGRPKKVDL